MQDKMSSLVPFTFSAIELQTLTINEKSWLVLRRSGKYCNMVKNQKLQPSSSSIAVRKNWLISFRLAVFMHTCKLASGFSKIQDLHQSGGDL